MDWIGKKKLKRFFSELEFADRKCCTIRRWTIYLSEYNLSSIFNIRHLGCLRSVYAITSPWQFMVCVLYMLHLMVVYDQCTLNASPYCCLWSVYSIIRHLGNLWPVFSMIRYLGSLWSVYSIICQLGNLWSVYTIIRYLCSLWSVYSIICHLGCLWPVYSIIRHLGCLWPVFSIIRYLGS